MQTYYEAEQASLFAPGSWSGRTSQGHSLLAAGKTSGRCSKKPRGSRTRAPLYLDLRRVDGIRVEPYWETDGVSLGAYSTLNFGECPSAAAESRLSQILEDTPPLKYYLSAKACAGILARARRRGKPLPPELEEALIRQSQEA